MAIVHVMRFVISTPEKVQVKPSTKKALYLKMCYKEGLSFEERISLPTGRIQDICLA